MGRRRHAGAAQSALERGDFATARRLTAAFPTRFPQSALRNEVRLVEARAASLSGQPKDAVAILEAILAPSTDAQGAAGSRAPGGASAGKKNAAAVALSPSIAQAARYDLALAYRALGRSAEADAILVEARQGPGRARRVGCPVPPRPVTRRRGTLRGIHRSARGISRGKPSRRCRRVCDGPPGDGTHRARPVRCRLEHVDPPCREVSRQQEFAAGTPPARRGRPRGPRARARGRAIQARRRQQEYGTGLTISTNGQTGRRQANEPSRLEPAAAWGGRWPSSANRRKPPQRSPAPSSWRPTTRQPPQWRLPRLAHSRTLATRTPPSRRTRTLRTITRNRTRRRSQVSLAPVCSPGLAGTARRAAISNG